MVCGCGGLSFPPRGLIRVFAGRGESRSPPPPFPSGSSRFLSNTKGSGKHDPTHLSSGRTLPWGEGTIKVEKGRPKVPGKVRVQFCHFWAPSIQKYMAGNGKTCFGAPGCQRARPAPQVGRRPRTTLAGVHAAGGRASARTFAALRGGSRIFRHVFCMEGAAKQKWQN